jgi:hypothetical protein
VGLFSIVKVQTGGPVLDYQKQAGASMSAAVQLQPFQTMTGSIAERAKAKTTARTAKPFIEMG